MPTYGSTDKVRATASRQYIEPARLRGDSKIEIHSGVLNKSLVAQRLLPPNRLPIVCNALKSKKFLQENHLILEEVKGPPSGRSSTVTFVYALKPASTPPKRESLFLGLRGIFKGVYDDEGGAETFFRKQRDEFDRDIF